MRKTVIIILLFGAILIASMGLCACAGTTRHPVFPIDYLDPYGTADDARFAEADVSDVITNGGFVNDTSNWTFAKEGKKGNPSGSWEPSGYANGGAAKISSEIGSNKQGIGYWQQIISLQIQAGSLVNLSYSFKTNCQY